MGALVGTGAFPPAGPARMRVARPEPASTLPQHACANKRHRADRECGRRTVPEVTFDVDGAVIDLDPSRWSWIMQRPLAVGRRIESGGYPAQRADPCIQSIHLYVYT